LTLASAHGSASFAYQATFQLVPSEAWPRLSQVGEAAFLKEGEIRLYRLGASEPELQGRLGEALTVPAGEWTWIGEAPGFITTAAGVLLVPEGAEGSKTIVWKAEPACRVTLGSKAWPGVERVDFVSLDFGAIFPSLSTAGQELQVPAGKFLYYTSTARGLGAISRVQSCQPKESVEALAPDLPGAGHQDLMVIAKASGELARKSGEVEASAKALPEGEAQAPTAWAYAAGWSAFFFLGLPVEGPLEIRLRHPEMRTERQAIEPLEGSARELNVALRERLNLIVPIDYLPKREHETAQVRAWACGDQERVVLSGCERLDQSLPLVEGLFEYRFRNLDGEKIVLEAEIDDEVLPNLGSGEVQDLREAAGPDVVAAPERLEEHHVYGHLLLAGKPVPGELRFEPLSPGTFAPRVFPTVEEDLQYHIYYFGQKQPFQARALYPEALWKKLEAGLFGLKFFQTTLQACVEGSFCRPFHFASSLIGDGRWDIDLGEDLRWQIQVLDAQSRIPLAGAAILLQPPDRERYLVHFVDGETIPPDKVGGEALLQRSDREGRARFISLAPETKFAVQVEGYQPFHAKLAEAGGGQTEIVVELKPLDQGEGLQLVVAGQPIPQGVVVVLLESGEGDPGCTAPLLADGFLYLRQSCRENPTRTVLVASPQSQLLVTTVGALPAEGQIPLPTRQGPPLEVQLVDGAGQPVQQAVGLRYQGLEITTNLLIKLSSGGMPQLHATNGEGVVRWPFLGAQGPLVDLLLPGLGLREPLFPEEATPRVRVVVDTASKETSGPGN
jgi:hypothetical protein